MDVCGDFIIVGSGIAGLRAAVELAGAGEVVILTKGDLTESNTEYAQGGIAAAIDADDSPERHAADTIAAGDGLCDEAAVRVLVGEGPRYTRDLLAWGAKFDRDEWGRPALGIEGAHSTRRVLHMGDATGREIGRVLWEHASARGRITVLKDTLAIDAILDGGRCTGVRFIDAHGRFGRAYARATLLATGGAGQVFQETTNPSVATGDGIALAFRAGARVADMEFVQFHPTVLNAAGAPRFLLSEALRGEGARLVTASGEAFMPRYHPAGDLAPRDVVARGMARESERMGGAPIFLSLAHLNPDFVNGRFPMISATCRRVGFDLAHDLVPVGPAAHYLMGGIETDLTGRTSIPGLFAAGEVACTRVHGANRLASNSLLEGLVFGARAGLAMRGPDAAPALPPPARRPTPDDVGARTPSDPPVSVSEEEVRALMWHSVGLFRDRDGLQRAAAALDEAGRRLQEQLDAGRVVDREGWRHASVVTVARLIARAALRREESRGGHFRTDFPAHDDLNWKVHVSDMRHPS
jgi:L-aspartate oxidase